MPDVLYPFGWNLLIAGLLAISVWLACRTRLLSRRPAVCHGLWLLVLLKLVTPPIASMSALTPLSNLESAATCPCDKSTCTCSSLIASGSQTNTGYPNDALPATALPILIPLLGISLLGTFVLWFVAVRRFLHVRRLLQDSAVESGRAAELLREVSRRFNSQAVVKLQIVDAPITPMLWAMPGNPAIVLPRQVVDSLNDDGLRSIFAHELAHFTRRDHWKSLFALVVATLFWWNPVAWFARRQLSTAAEACCDAVALQRLRGSRKTYAQTLLTVVDSLTTTAPQRSAFGIAFAESRSLRRRFELIADANVKAHNTRSGWILAATCFVAMMFIPARAQEDSAPAATSAEREAAAGVTRLPSGDGEGDLSAALCCPS